MDWFTESLIAWCIKWLVHWLKDWLIDFDTCTVVWDIILQLWKPTKSFKFSTPLRILTPLAHCLLKDWWFIDSFIDFHWLTYMYPFSDTCTHFWTVPPFRYAQEWPVVKLSGTSKYLRAENNVYSWYSIWQDVQDIFFSTCDTSPAKQLKKVKFCYWMRFLRYKIF